MMEHNLSENNEALNDNSDPKENTEQLSEEQRLSVQKEIAELNYAGVKIQYLNNLITILDNDRKEERKDYDYKEEYEDFLNNSISGHFVENNKVTQIQDKIKLLLECKETIKTNKDDATLAQARKNKNTHINEIKKTVEEIKKTLEKEVDEKLTELFENDNKVRYLLGKALTYQTFSRYVIERMFYQDRFRTQLLQRKFAILTYRHKAIVLENKNNNKNNNTEQGDEATKTKNKQPIIDNNGGDINKRRIMNSDDINKQRISMFLQNCQKQAPHLNIEDGFKSYLPFIIETNGSDFLFNGTRTFQDSIHNCASKPDVPHILFPNVNAESVYLTKDCINDNVEHFKPILKSFLEAAKDFKPSHVEQNYKKKFLFYACSHGSLPIVKMLKYAVNGDNENNGVLKENAPDIMLSNVTDIGNNSLVKKFFCEDLQTLEDVKGEIAGVSDKIGTFYLTRGTIPCDVIHTDSYYNKFWDLLNETNVKNKIRFCADELTPDNSKGSSKKISDDYFYSGKKRMVNDKELSEMKDKLEGLEKRLKKNQISSNKEENVRRRKSKNYITMFNLLDRETNGSCCGFW